MFGKFKHAKAKISKIFLFPTTASAVNNLTPYIDYCDLRGRTIDKFEF